MTRFSIILFIIRASTVEESTNSGVKRSTKPPNFVATNSEAFTDFAKWHFVHSIGGTDYISQLPIDVAANTPYHLKIEIDSARKASIFVNGIQYNVTTTSGSTGGTAVTTGTTPTAALTDDVDFIPYNGIEAGAAAAEALNTHFVAMSRLVYE